MQVLKTYKKPELLAPAQNKECAIAAIECGADSIYIGANLYGARKGACNSLEDIKEVINYAHKFNVKVYITINTILDDRELVEAQKLIEELYKIKADGIIFQDMGLLNLKLPDIKLIASTQCDIRSLDKVKFFDNAGIGRVILARELSLEEIKHICKNTSVEVETFVHGALCVSYSGQCYLSYKIGGRSANRGECAQACRKKYDLVDSRGRTIVKGKHLLSLKDFMAYNRLEELIKAGVSSFKIEGRLKDITYIRNTVAAYRMLLDRIIEKHRDEGYRRASSGESFFDFVPNLKKSFNRDFCEYFLSGKRGEEIWNFDTPNSSGEYLGRIIKTGKDGDGEYFVLEKEGGFAEGSARGGKVCGVSGKTCGVLDSKVCGVKGAACNGTQSNKVCGVSGRDCEARGRVYGAKINAQDGLCYFDKDGNLKGFLVNSVKDGKIYPNFRTENGKEACSIKNAASNYAAKSANCALGATGTRNRDKKVICCENTCCGRLFKGLKIYRNKDFEFENILKNSKTKRLLRAEFSVGEGFIRCIDEDNNTVETPYTMTDEARDTEKARKNWEIALKKSGGTDFYIEDVKFLTEKTYFLPVSKINELRRDTLERLIKLRIENYTPEGQAKPVQYAKYPLDEGDYRLNVHNKQAEEFYKNCGCTIKEYSLENGTPQKGKELMHTKHCIRYALNMCLKNTAQTMPEKQQPDTKNRHAKCAVKNQGDNKRVPAEENELFLIDEKGEKYRLKFDCAHCEMIVY